MSNPKKLYISKDALSESLGSNQVAKKLESHQQDFEIVRTGSRGMFWLEPLLEIDTKIGRVGFGPINENDVDDIIKLDESDLKNHKNYIGVIDDIPFLANQNRLTFKRVGLIDPLSIEQYCLHDGFVGLKKALEMDSSKIVSEVLDSGLRGRGGAAFPAGIKWKTVNEANEEKKYVVCNADEGDSGTFADRMTMEGDPFSLIEGMTIAGLASGATMGYIYIRSEYPHAINTMEKAIVLANNENYLGESILGTKKNFQLEVRKAAGSYVCGEETAMLESLEGRRGIVRAKPPIPALNGLFGKPTVVNNVLTFTSVPLILAKGASFFKNYGIGRSTGTLPFQLAGNIKHGGIYEKAFGITLRELVFDIGGGTKSGLPVKAIQVGGPLGSYIPEEKWDIPIDYEKYIEFGGVVGHGGVVVHDSNANLAELAKYAMEFCAVESCGKCTPCRIGSTRGVEVIERIQKKENLDENVVLLKDLCDVMEKGSLCAMGGMTPFPVNSALKYYPEDFGITSDDKALTN